MRILSYGRFRSYTLHYLHEAVEAALGVVNVPGDIRLLHPLLKEGGVRTQHHLVLEAVTNSSYKQVPLFKSFPL